ncbi:hypothetical protein [Afipia felis]|uniref:Uncharacterized protein n=2 Tax=Afipia felis TaxID=1035 RepID=A0A380WAF7_AFIFE|nr:hypothetical protein [Afipia felis]EKS29186.1 hypothetical protein HMPREF9697_01714 [Afipia felis ATCC 53690]SUU77893.1 Uncharacterised protein [Afipia felis]SUU85958.1 Uncharacterised protein [Afipia felis]
MRALAMPIVVASLFMGVSPIMAQSTPGSPNQEKKTQQERVTIRSIQVVDVEDLPPDMRSKVDVVLANTKQEDLKSLRESIDAMPEAVSALKAKGRNSAQVVAVNVDGNNTLTMFTRKAA